MLVISDSYREYRCNEFLKRTRQDDNGCLIFQGALDIHGYGRGLIFYQQVKLHRFIALSKLCANDEERAVAEQLHVCHTCDTPPCINWEHLFFCTQDDNIQDMIRKGRANHPKGEAASRVKLTQEQVDEIRAKYRVTVWSQRKLAEMYGVTRGAVFAIINGHTWVDNEDVKDN